MTQRHHIVGYAFQRTTDFDKLDVGHVTHLNVAFSLIYNDEFTQVNPVTGKLFGTPVNPDVRTPEPVPGGKLHTIYLPNKVLDDLGRIDKLRAQNPDLKVLLSVGGWDARGFSDAAATVEARQTFAASCRSVIDVYGLDGIDLDWEYPVSGGSGSIKARPEDRINFTLLLEAVREAIGSDKLLTIAGAAHDYFTSRWTEFEQVMSLLDYINMMTYDFQYSDYFGSALYPSKRWTSPTGGYCADRAVRNYIESGAPAEKIHLGLAFAAPIPQAVRTSAAWPEIEQRLRHAGFYDTEKPLLQRVRECLENKNGFEAQWDPDAQTMYVTTTLDDGTEQFVLSYIESNGVTSKTDYIKSMGLGGAMFWEFGADYNQALVKQLHRELRL